LITSAVPTEVIAAGRLRHRDGLVVHHTRLAAEHVMTLQGIRVTTVLRTMLDLATVLTQRGLERAFEEAQVLSGLLPAAVAAEVMMRTGHRGSRRLRAVLVGAVDPADVRSVLELRFLRMCAKHGLARPEVNKRLGRWRPDFFWPAARVVVETDSWRHHRTAAKRLQDARKDASLCEMGLRVIRLRWVDVAEHPRTTADVLRQALSSS
jgi:very-short-patch-repair endonuclease